MEGEIEVNTTDIKNALSSALSQARSWLLTFATLGIAILLTGWLAQRYGITFIRIPSAEPTQLVYAAGIVWLIR